MNFSFMCFLGVSPIRHPLASEHACFQLFWVVPKLFNLNVLFLNISRVYLFVIQSSWCVFISLELTSTPPLHSPQ